MLLLGRPDPAPDASSAVSSTRAVALIAEQVGALSSATDEATFTAAAGESSWARAVWQARTALGIDGVQLDYLSGGDAPIDDRGAREAIVSVAWRLTEDSVLGAGQGPELALRPLASTRVRLRLEPRSDAGFAVTAVGAESGPVPPWLVGPVNVAIDRGAVVVQIDGAATQTPLLPMVVRAEGQVRALLKGPPIRPVVLAAARPGQAAALVGRADDDVRNIAAITTTLDGSADGPQIVVVNPAQFASMDDRAAQVVLTHELVHLANDTVGRTTVPWVAEGFADFIALHDDTAPLQVSAGQILRQVRRGDVPATLPQGSDFAETGPGIGSVYESAWMVFRLLGQRFGTDAVIAFHHQVRDGMDLELALRRRFGLDVATLTAQWQDYLVKSASTVS